MFDCLALGAACTTLEFGTAVDLESTEGVYSVSERVGLKIFGGNGCLEISISGVYPDAAGTKKV